MGLILICTKIPSHGAAGERGVEVDANDTVVHREVFTLPGWDEAPGAEDDPFLSPGSVPAEVPQGAGAPRSPCARRSPRLCLGLGRRIPRDGGLLEFGVGQGTRSFVFRVSKEKVGVLAQKDDNADQLDGLCSSPL